MIHRESAAAYKAREAVSAGFLWEMASECPAYAYARSVFNPEPLPAKQSLEFNIGEATHLLTLEGKDFAARSTLIPYETYQTKDARDLRDQAYVDGRVPLRPRDYRLVCDLHDALRNSAAADLLRGLGENEVSYTWNFAGLACKARADRLVWPRHAIIDLKTADSASPHAFQRAMIRDGHHLRAAWYLDGFAAGGADEIFLSPIERFAKMDYLFVVVAKTPPHLITIFTTGEPRGDNWFPIEPGAIHKGRAEYRKALALFRQCRESGKWPGYTRRANQVIELPTWYEYQLALKEEESRL